MRRIIQLVLLCAGIAAAGCSMNRSDVVCDSNGKADQQSMSDDGKATSRFFQNGARLGLNF
jgi:hypothetical protein